MNRRAFLTGLVAAAAVPAFPAVASPLVEMFPPTLTAAQLEISRLIAEHWSREISKAFLLTMQDCGLA